MIDKYCEKAGVEKIAFRGFRSIRRSLETVMVSRGVPIESASQMMGHKTITEDKPYIIYNKSRAAFVAMDFSDVPIAAGFYACHSTMSSSGKRGGRERAHQHPSAASRGYCCSKSQRCPFQQTAQAIA